MRIDYWFDPICPWCWVTSRWLSEEVAIQRGLEINWRPISLLFKNKMEADHPYFEPASKTRDLLRVFLAVKDELGNEVAGGFYTAAGTMIHVEGRTDVTATGILERAGLDTKFAEAAGDETLDEVIKTEMADGIALVGEDVGTPIISYETPSGNRQGFFGPVISKKPRGEEALALWDAVTTLSSFDAFWELKRTRTVQPEFE